MSSDPGRWAVFPSFPRSAWECRLRRSASSSWNQSSLENGTQPLSIGEPGSTHILTCTVVGRLPDFTRPETVQILFDSWQFLQDQKRMDLLGYVMLENHVHFIASAEELAKEVGDFKSYTARRIIDYLVERRVRTLLDGLECHKLRHRGDRPFQLRQEGGHPKIIESEAMMRRKLGYIHDNPVKRGYVSDPVHWRYSIARNYAGIESLVNVMTDW